MLRSKAGCLEKHVRLFALCSIYNNGFIARGCRLLPHQLHIDTIDTMHACAQRRMRMRDEGAVRLSLSLTVF